MPKDGPPARSSGVAIAEDILVEHAGQWTCGVCLVATARVGHITGLVRQLRDRGWVIDTSTAMCAACEKSRSGYSLVDSVPSKRRATVAPGLRRTYLAARGHRDNFTGMPVPAGKLELDHRIPHAEAHTDEHPVLELEELAARYQPLSSASNQLKNQACTRCRSDGVRPAFMSIGFWREGTAARPADCSRCPYAFPEAWRDELAMRAGVSDLLPELVSALAS